MDPQSATSFSLEGLFKQVSAQKLPPVDKWHPDFCGNIDMRIKADGSWFYMGTPITRARMVKLFSTVLRKDDDGKTYLVTPVEKIGIEVDDAPFVAVAVERIGEGEDQVLAFQTNVGDTVVAGAAHAIWVEINEKTAEPRPYIRVRGNLDALITRTVFYELVEMAEQCTVENGTELKITSDGMQFSLGKWCED